MTEFRTIRKRIGTQAHVAAMLEISLSNLQRWERKPSRVALLALYSLYSHWTRVNKS